MAHVRAANIGVFVYFVISVGASPYLVIGFGYINYETVFWAASQTIPSHRNYLPSMTERQFL